MWVPPETKDPILLHHPTRRSVGYFGAVRLRDGKFWFRRETDFPRNSGPVPQRQECCGCMLFPIGGFMKLARVLLLISMAAGLGAQTSTWDTSGNGMLNGTYYFRHVLYQLSTAGDGTLYDTVSLYGTVTFSGTGTYSMTATEVDYGARQLVPLTVTNGTYSIAASGQGFLSHPLSTGDSIHGMVNAQGIFIGSSTENAHGYNDLFIAAPLGSPAPGLSTFKGTYSLAYMNFSGNSPQYTVGAMLQMSPDGAGNTGNIGIVAYADRKS